MSEINNPISTNIQKHEKNEAICKAQKALVSEFHSSVFIEYTIIEDRTESILRHAGKWVRI